VCVYVFGYAYVFLCVCIHVRAGVCASECTLMHVCVPDCLWFICICVCVVCVHICLAVYLLCLVRVFSIL